MTDSSPKNLTLRKLIERLEETPNLDTQRSSDSWGEFSRRVQVVARSNSERFASEITSDVINKMFSGSSFLLQKLKNAKNPEAYLAVVVRNVCRDILRRQSRFEILENRGQACYSERDPNFRSEKDADVFAISFAEALELEVIKIDDYRLLEQLSQGASIQEIGSRLELTDTAVRKRISRARLRFRAAFLGHEKLPWDVEFAHILAEQLEIILRDHQEKGE